MVPIKFGLASLGIVVLDQTERTAQFFEIELWHPRAFSDPLGILADIQNQQYFPPALEIHLALPVFQKQLRA